MMNGSTVVGMDVHKKTIQICTLLPIGKRVEWKLDNTQPARKKLVRKLRELADGSPIRACYEAGPCGYGFYRELEAKGISCMIAAPSLIPRKPGEHIKTDKKDARKLAEYLKNDMLTEVHPPSEDDEAVRGLCRARDDVRKDLTRQRHRLSHFLVKLNVVFTEGRTNWTQKHHRWLQKLKFDRDCDQYVFDSYLLAVDQGEALLKRLGDKIHEVSVSPKYKDPIGRLRCFRGIDTISAMAFYTELHNFSRFAKPKELMSYIGLVPKEHSSGDSTKRGGISKAGNTHVRRILIEASWNYRRRPMIGAVLKKRREDQSTKVIAIADKAQHRLHKKYTLLYLGKSKPHNKVITAVARELVGFLWAALQPEEAAEKDPRQEGAPLSQSVPGRR